MKKKHVKIYHKEMRYETVAQGRDQWRAFVNAVMILRIEKKGE
jgi:hypothetical protein